MGTGCGYMMNLSSLARVVNNDLEGNVWRIRAAKKPYHQTPLNPSIVMYVNDSFALVIIT